MRKNAIVTMVTYISLLFSTVALAGVAEDVAALKPGEWYEIPNSRLADALFSQWNIPGNSSIYSYSGGGYDSTGNRLLVFGGGHLDYGGNEIYGFNFDLQASAYDFQWTIIADPSSYEDIIYCKNTDCGGYLPDGRPESRHTYNHIDYHPKLNALVSVVQIARYGVSFQDHKEWFDYYDFDTSRWERKANYPVLQQSQNNHLCMSVDSSTGDIWSVGNRQNRDLWQWDYGTNKWIKRYGDTGVVYNSSESDCAVDLVNKVFVVIGNGGYDVFSIDPNDFDPVTGFTKRVGQSDTYSGPNDVVTAVTPSIEYDPSSGLIVCWLPRHSPTTDVFVLDVTTHTFERIPAAGTNQSTPPSADRTYGRWQAIDNGLFALTTNVHENVFIYKLGNYGSASPPPLPQSGLVYKVGPTRTYQTFGAAIAAIAADGNPSGAVIEADAGIYLAWKQSCGYASDNFDNIITTVSDNLTIRGVGGKAHIQWMCRGEADGDRWTVPGGKGLITQASHNLTIEDIEFSGGCNYSGKNGAGIWVAPGGIGLKVRRSSFHDNDNGILAGEEHTSDILIEHCEFYNNGYGDGHSHNVYIGEVNQLTFRYNYSHSSKGGQLLKSRAATNYVYYNRLTDEANSNYNIDLPNGGASYVIGNLLEKSPTSSNDTFINYGREVFLDIKYTDGGLEELKDGTVVTNSRTSKTWTLRYNYNYGATGSWANHDRASHCDFKVVESDNPDFKVGDVLTYGSESSITVTSVDWTWAGEIRELYVINNTFVNNANYRYKQYVIRAHIDTSLAVAQNNLIIDLGGQQELVMNIDDTTKEKRVTELNNYWATSDSGLIDVSNYDFRPTSSATGVIDQGTNPGSANGVTLAPIYEYSHKASYSLRPSAGSLDIGAYEYSIAAANTSFLSTPNTTFLTTPNTEYK